MKQKLTLTPFGKVLRDLRMKGVVKKDGSFNLEKGILLGELADKLKMSPAELSKIEFGEAPIPDDLFSKIGKLDIFTFKDMVRLSTSLQKTIAIPYYP
jgi:transcriptional regulator with XRE-family HTH domain